ncbi:MAG: hypothetical protein ACI4M3_03035 [Acutalibacteraceae bacterium]
MSYNYGNTNGNNNYGGNYNNGFNNNNMDPGYGFGIASLVCGIIAVVLSFVGGSGLIPAILGVIFSVMSGNRSATVGLPRNGMATGGLICSCISLALSLLVLLSCITCFGCFGCATCTQGSYAYYWH